MKRKLAMAIIMMIISMGLAACGSNDAELADSNQSIQESSLPENQPNDSIQNEVIDGEENTKSQIEDATINAQEDTDSNNSTFKWYMDSEGLKNDEMGVVIKKNNGALRQLGLWETVNFFDDNTFCGVGDFYCDYYDGDLDSYISENTYLEKTAIKIGDVEYTYGENLSGNIAFVGNGIVVSAALYIQEGSVSDYLNSINLIKPYDSSTVDCLAYLTGDGLYCPALGIKLACDEGMNEIERVGTSCHFAEDYFASIYIQNEYISEYVNVPFRGMYYAENTKSAQEKVDQYVEWAIEPDEFTTIEYSAIDGTVEAELGKHIYLGRGVSGHNEAGISGYSERKEWLFYSDRMPWSIVVSYDADNGKYEDYLGIIENLE